MIAGLIVSMMCCGSLSPFCMLADPPEALVGITPSEAGAPGVNRNPTSFANYKCKQFSSCPPNIVIADQNGNVVGCSVFFRDGDGMISCTGSCYTCAGSQVSMKVCSASDGNTCVIPPSYRIITCGLTRKHTNACTSARPSGVPQTPNGCYCDLAMGFVTNIDPCEIAECR